MTQIPRVVFDALAELVNAHGGVAGFALHDQSGVPGCIHGFARSLPAHLDANRCLLKARITPEVNDSLFADQTSIGMTEVYSPFLGMHVRIPAAWAPPVEQQRRIPWDRYCFLLGLVPVDITVQQFLGASAPASPDLNPCAEVSLAVASPTYQVAVTPPPPTVSIVAAAWQGEITDEMINELTAPFMLVGSS
jgi:hypothetical protein